jgi:hypothetical protein
VLDHLLLQQVKCLTLLPCVRSSALEMLAKTPHDLEQLAEAVAFQKRLVDDKARIAGRFEPLRYVRMLQWGVQTFGFQVSECQISTVLCRPAHFLHLFAVLAACLTESTCLCAGTSTMFWRGLRCWCQTRRFSFWISWMVNGPSSRYAPLRERLCGSGMCTHNASMPGCICIEQELSWTCHAAQMRLYLLLKLNGLFHAPETVSVLLLCRLASLRVQTGWSAVRTCSGRR